MANKKLGNLTSFTTDRAISALKGFAHALSSPRGRGLIRPCRGRTAPRLLRHGGRSPLPDLSGLVGAASNSLYYKVASRVSAGESEQGEAATKWRTPVGIMALAKPAIIAVRDKIKIFSDFVIKIVSSLTDGWAGLRRCPTSSAGARLTPRRAVALATTLSALWLVVLSFTSVHAQSSSALPSETQAERTGEAAESETPEEAMKKFLALPTQGLELPKNTATPFATLFKDTPEGVTEDTTGVNLNGYIRYVPHEGENYVQAVMTTVSKGDIEVPLADQEAVNGQFKTEKLTIDTTDELPLKAKPEVLNDALKKLAEAEANLEDEELETKPEQPAPAQQQVAGNSGGGATGSGVQSGTQFQPQPQQDFVEPKTEIKITEDGCGVRIDRAQNAAIQQNKTVTLEDGKEKSSAECEDSLTRYILQKSFEGCDDVIDISALTVFRQSKTYYNKDGAQITVSGCAKDTSATYAITEDTTGCAPVVDQASRKVHVHAKLVYTGASNSQVVVRNCQVSKTQPAYALQKSYDSCTHKVDIPAKIASARYKDYYVNSLGTRSEVSDCTVDTNKQWEITEREGACKVFVDFTKDNEQVFKQSTLHYIDDEKTEHEARGCDKSTLTEPVPMVKDTHLCNIRHDFDNNESAQMFLWKYTLDGVAYQASACSDTDVRYPHKKYTIDASGGRVCPVKVDQDKRLVTLYHRTGIIVDDHVQYITECTPDTENTLDVVATTEGCTDPASWQHDLANAVSYDNERWYYELNGTREYVTACQRGSKTYKHSETIVGWQLHDDKLYGFPMSKVTIDAPIGEYVVSLNTVLPGAVQQPYVLKETKNVLPANNTGKPDSYEGCTGLFKTNRTEFYQRPDKTEYTKIVGKGEPIEEEICFEEFVEEKSFITKLRVVTSPYNYNNLEVHTTTYAKFRKYNKYTNADVTFAFEKRRSSSSMSGSTFTYRYPANTTIRTTPSGSAAYTIDQFNETAGKFGGQKHPTFTPGKIVNNHMVGQCARFSGTEPAYPIFSPFDCPSSINRGTLYTSIPDDSKVKW